MKFTLFASIQRLLNTVSNCNDNPICKYPSIILVQKTIIIARIIFTNKTSKSRLLTNIATSSFVLS